MEWSVFWQGLAQIGIIIFIGLGFYLIIERILRKVNKSSIL